MSDTIDMSVMYAMHNALRRELELIAKVTARIDDSPRRILATAAGWEIFKKALNVHHGAEDEALWPPMRVVLASKPDDLALLEVMETDHLAIDQIIAAVDAALADRDSGADDIGDRTDALATLLGRHLREEEDAAMPLIGATVTPEQWQHFGDVHRSRMGTDGPTIIPWLLDGADEHTTATMLGLLPEPVRAAYRDQWRPAYAALDRWNTGR